VFITAEKGYAQIKIDTYSSSNSQKRAIINFIYYKPGTDKYKIDADSFSRNLLISLGLGSMLSAWRWHRGPRDLPAPDFSVSLAFGLFSIFMPLIGWDWEMRYRNISVILDPGSYCFLLMAIGLKMLWEGFKTARNRFPIFQRMENVSLSFATSIDALGVGFGFG